MNQEKSAWRWRRTLINLHRDLGYLVVGMTVVYVVSGIAVNHREHWDYNYSRESRRQVVGTPEHLLELSGDRHLLPAGQLARARQADLVTAIYQSLGRTAPPIKVFWRSPGTLTLIYQTGERDQIDYMPQTGVAEFNARSPRPVFRQFNLLHLNERRGLWTYLADAYALILLFLAISGAVVVKGRRGLRGRGGVLMVAGFALPLLAYWVLVAW